MEHGLWSMSRNERVIEMQFDRNCIRVWRWFCLIFFYFLLFDVGEPSKTFSLSVCCLLMLLLLALFCFYLQFVLRRFAAFNINLLFARRPSPKCFGEPKMILMCLVFCIKFPGFVLVETAIEFATRKHIVVSVVVRFDQISKTPPHQRPFCLFVVQCLSPTFIYGYFDL